MVDGEDVPMSLQIRPFNQDYVVALTGGRFSAWLERAGTRASEDLVKEKLKKLFGADIIKRVTGATVTAWSGDPWVNGAYSAAMPGQFHQRGRLAEPVDERLFFAGEATAHTVGSCHGAYWSGVRAAREVSDVLIRSQ